MESTTKRAAFGDSYDPEIIEASDYQKAETLLEYGLPTSSSDVKKLIATVSAGTLLLLGQTNQFFAAVARDDTTWKTLFQRDFPRDYAFINGTLPFYVPSSGKSIVNDDELKRSSELEKIRGSEASSWKRFYLHTRRDYIKFWKQRSRKFIEPPIAETFIKCYDDLMRESFSNNSILVEYVGQMSKTAPAYMKICNEFVQHVTSFVIFNLQFHETPAWLMKYVYCSYLYENEQLFWLSSSGRYLSKYPEAAQSFVWWQDLSSFTKEKQEVLLPTLFSQEDFREFSLLYIPKHLKLQIDRSKLFSNADKVKDSALASLICANVFRFYKKQIMYPCLLSYYEKETYTIIETRQAATAWFNCGASPRALHFFDFLRLGKITIFVDYKDHVMFLFNKYSMTPRNEENKILFLESCVNCNVDILSNQSFCGGCRKVAYCGEECADEHWIKDHHKKCGK